MVPLELTFSLIDSIQALNLSLISFITTKFQTSRYLLISLSKLANHLNYLHIVTVRNKFMIIQ